MGAGGSTGVREKRRERREKKKEKKQRKRRRRRKGLGDEPPSAAISAAATRGDVVALRGSDGELISLSLCKRKRLEYSVDGKWIKALDRLTVETGDDDTIRLRSRRMRIISSPWNDQINGLLVSTARLCDVASISHNLWGVVQISDAQHELRCMSCGLQYNTAPPFCSATGRVHPPQLWYRSTGERPPLPPPAWNDATQLPAGSSQVLPHVNPGTRSMMAPIAQIVSDCKQLDSHLLTFINKDCRPCAFLLTNPHRLEYFESKQIPSTFLTPDIPASTPSVLREEDAAVPSNWVCSFMHCETPSLEDGKLILQKSKGLSVTINMPVDSDFLTRLGELCDNALVTHNMWCLDEVTRPQTWPCPACLFKNNDSDQCKVCGASRPQVNLVSTPVATPSLSHIFTPPPGVSVTPGKAFLPPPMNLDPSPGPLKVIRNLASPILSPTTLPDISPEVAVSGYTLPPSLDPGFRKFALGRENRACSPSSSFSDDDYDDDCDIISTESEEGAPLSPGRELVQDVSQTKIKECCVCLSSLKNTVLMPCRHLCICSSCGPIITVCPLCHKGVTHRLQVWV